MCTDGFVHFPYINTSPSNRYIISDIHLGHKRLSSFRRLKKSDGSLLSSEEQNEMVLEHLSMIPKKATLFLLGDIAFDKYWLDRIKTVPCRNKILVVGNHDLDRGTVTMRDLVDTYDQVYSLHKYKNYWMSHAPIHPVELRGKKNIHGHCVDLKTEILTKDGWKSYDNICVGDIIYNFNPNSRAWEYDKVNEVVENLFTGNVYSLKSKGLDMRVTDKHRVIFSTINKDWVVETADKAFQRSTATFTRSFLFENKGIPLSDDLLRLYILLAADGCITEAGLGRLRFSKERKIIKSKQLLNTLNIEFTENKCSRGMTNINFKIPDELKEFNIKGLDTKLLECTREQAEVIKETYSWTDGNRNLIFTSKKSEVDILQHLFVKNGYSCKVHSRDNHGFSKKTSYQLSVTDVTTQGCYYLKDKVKIESVDKELFWCITTKNGNFMARRNGSVFLTGNCHPYLMLDENGVPDSNYINVCCEYTGNKPIPWEYAISDEYYQECLIKWKHYMKEINDETV